MINRDGERGNKQKKKTVYKHLQQSRQNISSFSASQDSGVRLLFVAVLAWRRVLSATQGQQTSGVCSSPAVVRSDSSTPSLLSSVRTNFSLSPNFLSLPPSLVVLLNVNQKTGARKLCCWRKLAVMAVDHSFDDCLSYPIAGRIPFHLHSGIIN